MGKFNEDALFEIVKDVAYPRLVGTPGEKKVIEYTKTAFETRGFSEEEVQSQEFTFSRFFGGTMIQLLAFALTIFLLNFSILLLFNPVMNAFLLVAFLVVAYFFLKANNNPESLKSQLATTENIFVRVPSRDEKKGTIVLSAHHDSKGQNFITVVRAALFLFGILLGVLTLLTVLLSLLIILFQVEVPFYLRILGSATGFPAAVLFFALVFNAVNNKSLGAVDNATGMAIVLELMRAVKEEGGLQHYEVIGAIFSAEEYGMMGARFWMQEYGEEFSPKHCYNINYDMVTDPVNFLAAGGLVKKPVNKRLNDLFEKVATSKMIPVSGFWLPVGAMTDRFVFSKHGWEGMDVVTRKAANFAHSYSDDTIEKVSPRALREVCEISLGMLHELDG